MFDSEAKHARYSPWSQLAILFFLTGIGFLVGGFISLGIANSYLHVPLENLGEALKNNRDANLSRWLQFVSTFFFMLVPALVFASMMSHTPFKYIGFNSAVSNKQVLIIFVVVFVSIVLSSALSQLNGMIPISKSAEKYFKTLEDEYTKEMLGIANMKSAKDYIITLFIIALLPALFEEMLFRGALQPVFINITKNAFVGILITSILFSAIHMSFYGFLPRLALGLIIGYIFYFSKNLWLSSLTHFLYNAFGVTQIYMLSKKGLLTPEAMKDDDSFPLIFGLFAAIVLFILFFLFKKESKSVTAENNLNKEYLE